MGMDISIMDVSINEQNQEHIRRKVKTGIYQSTDEVIARALELLDEHDSDLEQELAEIRARVQRGIEQADAGQLIPAGEVFEELRRRNAVLKKRPE
jgi:antitoxin ParD1/3/4